MGRTTCVLLAVFLLLFAGVEYAAAKRLGGGGSMGNRQSFSTSTTPRPDMGAPSGSFSSQQARPNPTGATPGGGFFSRPGIGGMLGGLAVGGLLGSMLFGGGGHGYGGPGILDMLLIGGGLFLLFKFLRSRRQATAGGPAMGRPMERTYEPQPAPQAAAAAGGWANLGAEAAPAGPTLPPGFDTEEFLAGAKALFARMQRSWSQRNLADIEAFSTAAFMADVRQQAAADPTPTPTDVLLVDAKLLEVRSQNGVTIASAYFDTLLREDPKAGQPEQVREVWHFVRRETVPGDSWKLDAIQQMDS
ncbi:Tim44 domain-containing protein [Desulfovibrio sp. DV]|uniref:Tim44 domain-containing protein n=1 Tax=Desulfovibrio sp. DV TaxID=1844708 RepID=UPI00094B862C|nr:Tim44-like domain-containing protein [Desulfovibrio sp. DV]